ncbi:peptidase T [bacterium]|nr:peptidase T [bacterium]
MRILPVRRNNINIEKPKYSNNRVVSYPINEERMTDTFVKIAKIDTGSNHEVAEKQIPSTECQKNLAAELKNRLTELGLKDVEVDEYSTVTATLESNVGKSPTIGLLAHMDTSPDAPNKGVNPQIHNYNGGDINLKNGTVIAEKDLAPFKGHRIITSDGTTLLGADDKSGIAEILEAINVFKENPDIKHPRIRIAFTPDEETGMGIGKFDIKKFGADAAYTVDGDLPNVIEDESFNAFNPEIVIKGKNVHTGYAKEGGMINSAKVATWIANKLPKKECPEQTEGKQGFYHINSISGDVNETKISMLVRDHDMDKAKARIEKLEKIIAKAQKKFGCEIEFDKKERYHNMKESINKFPQVMDFAREGLRRSGLTPVAKSIRGGTDGSQLSLLGLPTPNLGAGGINFHSVREFVSVDVMKKCVENILNIMTVWAENSQNVLKQLGK